MTCRDLAWAALLEHPEYAAVGSHADQNASIAAWGRGLLVPRSGSGGIEWSSFSIGMHAWRGHDLVEGRIDVVV
jgi:hypothetical protein